VRPVVWRGSALSPRELPPVGPDPLSLFGQRCLPDRLVSCNLCSEAVGAICGSSRAVLPFTPRL
jgi:hypothetical protein